MKTFLLAFAVLFALNSAQADQCQSCKKIFNFISNVTHNGDDNLKESLTRLCTEYSYLPGKQSEVWCQKAVNGFFNVINKSLNTSTVCYDIKACKDASDNGIRELTLSHGKKEDCDFCIFVAGKVKDILSGGPTEVEIRTVLEDGCHYLGNFESECLNIADQYANDLFKFINESFQPSQFCKSLKVCSGVRTGPLKPVNSLPSATDLINILPANLNVSVSTETVQSPLTDINCDICKKIVKIIQTQLKDNATDQQIVHVLTEVCELFPSKEKANCNSMVTDYTTRLIQVLTQDIDSNLACTLVGLCVPANFWNYINKPKNQPVVTKKNNNVACVECQLLTHFLQNELYNYKNEEQIEEFIKNHFCTKVSYFINEASCKTFIEEYGPIIMQTIAQEIFDPTTFCFKEIHVCTKPKFVEDIAFNNEEKRCQICQEIVKDLNEVASHDLELENLVKKSCSHLPKAHQIECGLMMKAFAPYFFDMLNHNDNAKEICSSIDLCRVPGQVQLLGGHKCTYGPSYWCHTAAHASACNADSYCRQKVWKAIN